MAYSGRYKVKNKDKYKGDHTNVIYRSKWERYCFEWCDNNPKIRQWSSEETVIPYIYEIDHKIHRYFVDLKITMTDGKTILIEIKPDKETRPPKKSNTKQYLNESLTYVKNQNKWKAANDFAKDRGWAFQIWTEKTLISMGIMPKYNDRSMKPLKPLKKKK